MFEHIWCVLNCTSLGSLTHALIIRGESTCPIWTGAWLRRLDFGARRSEFSLLFCMRGMILLATYIYIDPTHPLGCMCAHTSSRVAPPTGAAWYGRPAASPWASNKHPRTIAFSSERVGNSQQDTRSLKTAAVATLRPHSSAWKSNYPLAAGILENGHREM